MREESPHTRISPQTQPSLHAQLADAVRTVSDVTDTIRDTMGW